MGQNNGFSDSFRKVAKVSMRCILAQAVMIAYLICSLFGYLVKDNDAPYGSLIVAILVGIGILIAHLIFCVNLDKLEEYKKGFKTVSVYGTAACLLTLTGLISVVTVFQSALLQAVVGVIIAILIVSVKPVYYWLMHKEISERMPGKMEVLWRILLILGIVAIFLFVAALGSALFYNVHDYRWQDAHKVFQDIAFNVLLFVAPIVYVVRIVFEFICTLMMSKRLKETN